MPDTLDAAVEDGPRRNRLSGRGKVGVALAATLAVVAAVALLLVPFRWTGSQEVTVNAYAVPSAEQSGGREESFAAVAERTLGSAARADEVFVLNRGRSQVDGSVVGSSAELLRPGWVLVLPADATGPEVRPARTVQLKPYWTWPLVLSLAGAVLVGVLTVLVVARRVVTDGSGRLSRWLRGLPGAARHRARSRAERVRLRAALEAGLGGPTAVAVAIDEIAARSDGGVHAATADTTGVRAWVSPVTGPPTGWSRVEDGVWERRGLPPVQRDPRTGSLPVRVGGGQEGSPVLVDLTRVDGVVAVIGDRAVAGDVIAQMVRDAVAQRPELTVVTLPVQETGDLAALPGAANDPGPRRAAAPEPDGTAGLFVAAPRAHEVTGIVVVPFEPDPAVASALVAATSSGGWVVLVKGDVPGASRRWEARRDGVLALPELGREVVAPMRAAAA